jgi:hypothetical protein
MLVYIEGLGEVELLSPPTQTHKQFKSTPHQQFRLDFMCHGIDKPIQYTQLLQMASIQFDRQIRDLAELSAIKVYTLIDILKGTTVHPST